MRHMPPKQAAASSAGGGQARGEFRAGGLQGILPRVVCRSVVCRFVVCRFKGMTTHP